jgi:geranylgeranyl diphosphate synthase type II
LGSSDYNRFIGAKRAPCFALHCGWGRSPPTPRPSLQSIHRRKTGALFRASLRLGAIAADASPLQLEALTAFGELLGHAFQVVDDLLDVAGEEGNVGKRLNKDRQRGKVTYPSLLGVEESRRRAADLVERACLALEPLGPRATPLRELAEFVGRRSR